MIHIVGVEPADPFKLLLEFNIGERKLVDIEQYLRGPVFRLVREDTDYFRLVVVDEELGVTGLGRVPDQADARGELVGHRHGQLAVAAEHVLGVVAQARVERDLVHDAPAVLEEPADGGRVGRPLQVLSLIHI